MKWAKYSLPSNSPSFDVMTFMQVALHKGAEAIKLVEGLSGWSGYGGEKGEAQRVQDIVLPVFRLYGMKVFIGEKLNPEDLVWPLSEAKDRGSHGMQHLVTLKKPFPIHPTQEALDRTWDKMGGKKRIVLAERDCNYHIKRNTSDGLKRWAREVDAFVVPDFTPLDDRVAAYELAQVTVGNNAGNITPAAYSYRPVLIFKMIVEDYKATKSSFLENKGIVKGWQYPWFRPNQRICWDHDDSYEGVCKGFEEYQAALRASGERTIP